MTPSRQERNHPTSSSSSFTSPTTTVWSDSETRKRDSHPVHVSSSHVERIERGDPFCSEIPERLQEFRENLVDDRVPESRGAYASSSHELSLEPTRSVNLGKHSVYTHFPKDRSARSVRGPKLQVLRAEDAFAEPYLVQKILVIWLQHITKVLVKVVNLVPSSICNRGAGLDHPMDPVVHVQNLNFSENGKELAKVLAAK